MRGVHLKRKLKYTEKAGVVASWLLCTSQSMHEAILYSECYNRDRCPVDITSKIKSRKFLFKEKFANP